jgi:Na+/H+-dicarboxylate symporter
MTRTAVNVTGDLMCTAVVARSEGEFEPAVFGAENTGRRRGRE